MDRHRLSPEGPYAFPAPACDASQMRLMRQRLHGSLIRCLVDGLTDLEKNFSSSRLLSQILLFQFVVFAVR